MDKKSLSFLAVGLLIGTLSATIGYSYIVRLSGTDAASGVLMLRLAHSLNESHPTHDGMVFMARRLAELSGDRVRIEIFPNSQLGSETECLEQVQTGVLDLTKVSTAPMEAFVPEMSVFGLPYLFRDDEHYWSVLEGDVGKRLLIAGEPYGLRGLSYYDAGARSFYTTKSPVLKPEDLIGRKIRVMKSDTAIQMVKILGGSPAPISPDELYTALQQGMVDGAENNAPTYLATNHYDVAKHFSLDEHTRIPDLIVISKHRWDSLSAQQREWLQQAAIESSSHQRESWRAASESALEEVQRRGAKVYRPDLKPFADKSKSMLESIESPELKRLVLEIRKAS